VVHQEALWQQAKAMTAIDREPVPTGLFIQSLNEMIDDQGKRLSALRNRIPNSVLITLFGIVAVAGAFASYGNARDVERTRLPIYVMVLLVSAVIFLIMDLDRPSAGFITNSQQPMIDLAASIASFS
jgi:Na+/glutamate symporter